jgi:hypothetical protein
VSDARVLVDVELPEGLLREFFQHVRDFDSRYPECRINMHAESGQSTEEIRRIFASLVPPIEAEVHSSQ